jgi:hypothetical protein
LRKPRLAGALTAKHRNQAAWSSFAARALLRDPGHS